MQHAPSDILKYERPSLTADCVLLRIVFGGESRTPVLQVRLVRRPNAPEKGKLALIGAFISIDERVEEVLSRCVRDKAGIGDFFFEQLYTFDTPGRDERWRVVSIAHLGIVSPNSPENPIEGAEWYDIDVVNRQLIGASDQESISFDELAFDHAEILDTAIQRLRGKVLWTDIVFRFMPDTFTISQLKSALSLLAGKSVNNVKRDFGKYLEPVSADDVENGESKRPAHRPATLYQFAGSR